MHGFGAVADRNSNPRRMTEKQVRNYAERLCAEKNGHSGYGKPFWRYSLSFGPVEKMLIEETEAEYRRVSFYHQY